MPSSRPRPGTTARGGALALAVVVLAGCGTGSALRPTTPSTTTSASRPTVPAATGTTSAGNPATTQPTGHPRPGSGGTVTPLPVPAALAPFDALATPGEGEWHAAGRPVDGVPAVYETTLVPPGGTEPAGVAWMDTHLLTARLYSGSLSPGGGPYRYTAPVQPADAATLVAAFNGGFLMADAGGGYYTEGRVVVPLVPGAASLVIHADGAVDIGAWGADVAMGPDVVAVRQNLVPLVAHGVPTAQAAGPDWQAWGDTCGATSCAHAVPGVEQQWRSGVGVTADGALVYTAGPVLAPAQLAQLLVHAGAVRAMELDINPSWTVLATYDPIIPGGTATALDGARLLPTTVQGPATFFEPTWARDFVTMSARTPTGAG